MRAILEPSRCPRRLLGRQVNAGAKAHGPSCSAQNPASLSYGSSRACNATSVGSPADSKSPVALRVLARARIAVSWCGRFPAGGASAYALVLVRLRPRDQPLHESCTSRPSFGNPADSESPVALRSPLARGLPFRFEPVLYRSNLVQRRAPCHQKRSL